MMLRMNAFGPQARRRIRSYSNANHQSTLLGPANKLLLEITGRCLDPVWSPREDDSTWSSFDYLCLGRLAGTEMRLLYRGPQTVADQ